MTCATLPSRRLSVGRRLGVVSAGSVQEDGDSLLEYHSNQQQITGLPRCTRSVPSADHYDIEFILRAIYCTCIITKIYSQLGSPSYGVAVNLSLEFFR